MALELRLSATWRRSSFGRLRSGIIRIVGGEEKGGRKEKGKKERRVSFFFLACFNTMACVDGMSFAADRRRFDVVLLV